MNSHTLESYRDRPHWSYSSLNQILNICSLQWCFEKLEKLPRPFTPIAIAFGGVYHRVMEFIALSRMEQKLPTENDTRDLFHDLWKREGDEGPPLEKDEEVTPDEFAKQGAELAVAYLKQIDPEERVVTMNEVFAAPVGDSERPIIGEIDCVVERAGDLAIVDWKTSAKRWPKTQADRSLQPTVYLYAHKQLHPESEPSFRFDVAVKNKTPVIERNITTRTEDDFRRLECLVNKAERVIEHELFYPSDQSFFCGGCPFREPCRAWHRRQSRVLSLAA
jgi:putative RecB family exonuclease